MKMILFSCFFLVTLTAQSSIQIDQFHPSQVCGNYPPTCPADFVCVGDDKDILCDLSNGFCVAVDKNNDILFKQCCQCDTTNNDKTKNECPS